MQEILTHNIPAVIFVLGVIIFVHESGHLLVAKAFGMRVFIFSFGFGSVGTSSSRASPRTTSPKTRAPPWWGTAATS
jgi:membrane-associated protease RseP (regulator of RpoE activity)